MANSSSIFDKCMIIFRNKKNKLLGHTNKLNNYPNTKKSISSDRTQNQIY